MFDTSYPSRDDPLKEYSILFPNKLNNELTNAPWKRLNRNIALIKSVFVAFKLHFNSKYIFD